MLSDIQSWSGHYKQNSVTRYITGSPSDDSE